MYHQHHTNFCIVQYIISADPINEFFKVKIYVVYVSDYLPIDILFQTDNSHLFLKDSLDINELKLKRLRISKKDENDHMPIMNNCWKHII